MAKIVHLDYGHGGKDPGAIGNGLREKDMTLQIGTKVSNILKSHGVLVTHSRTTDKYLSLTERTNIANKNGVDVFASIHINSFGKPSANGVETYSSAGSYEGARLAKMVQDQLVNAKLFKSNRDIKTAKFTVLVKPKAPSILTELGFISNKDDANIMQNKQNELAQAVANGVLRYLNIKSANNTTTVVKPQPKPNTTGNLTVDGHWGPATTRALQKYFKTTVDGVISGQYPNNTTRSIPSVSFSTRTGSNAIKALQRKIGAKSDGYIGVATVRALQKHLGTTVDGHISRPSSMVKELQRRLNKGNL